MSSPERSKEHAFSTNTINIAEQFHGKMFRVPIIGTIARAVTGANSDAFRHVTWTSKIVSSEIANSVIVPGDPNVGKYLPKALPRLMKQLTVMGADWEELEELKKSIGENSKEAAAYFDGNGTVHVGTIPGKDKLTTDKYNIFSKIDNEARLAMRFSLGEMNSMMGMYDPNKQFFAGLNVRTVDSSCAIRELVDVHPNVLVV